MGRALTRIAGTLDETGVCDYLGGGAPTPELATAAARLRATAALRADHADTAEAPADE